MNIKICGFCLIGIIVCFLVTPVSAIERIDDLFAEGNKAYEQEDYQTAVQRYEDILKYEVDNPAVYFNLGNAYFMQSQIGQAILYYEKAHKLAPRDSDISENLTLAQLMTVDKVERPNPGLLGSFLTTFYNFFSINELAWLTALHFIGVMILICVIILSRPGFIRRLAWYLCGFGIALLFVFGSTFYLKIDDHQNITQAIVLSPKLDVYSRPNDSGDISFTIHEGKKVDIISDRNDWVEIELENGWQGWVPQTELGRI